MSSTIRKEQSAKSIKPQNNSQNSPQNNPKIGSAGSLKIYFLAITHANFERACSATFSDIPGSCSKARSGVGLKV
jgi:hypothetical protein